MLSPQKLLRKYNLRALKSRGQNFLVSTDTALAVLRRASLNKEDAVIEVGTGLGYLTIPLAGQVKEVISFEIDPRLIEIMHSEYEIPPNMKIVHRDILRADFPAISRETEQKLKIIGNLPYYISSPILFKVWETRAFFLEAFFMLQKEVADRLLSPPGHKEYGILSVLYGYCADIKELLKVPASQFFPRPEVDSKVVGIHFREPNVEAQDENFLTILVKTAFQKRRKTMQNALASVPSLSPADIKEALEAIDIDPKRRPETLSPEEFARLSNLLKDKIPAEST